MTASGYTFNNNYKNTSSQSLIDSYSTGLGLGKSLVISLITHALIPILYSLLLWVLTLLGISISVFDKPELKSKDLEFVLVNQEKIKEPPKDAKLLSDRNAQGGGKHDPKRAVSEMQRSQQQAKPQPKVQPKPKPRPQPRPQPQKQQIQRQEILQPQQPKPQQKPIEKPQQKAPPKPIVRPNNSPFKLQDNNTSKPLAPISLNKEANSQATSSIQPITMYQKGSSGSKGGSSQMNSTSSSNPGSRGSQGSRGALGNAGNPSAGSGSGVTSKAADFGPYMRDLQRQIKRNWNPPRKDQSKRVVAYFRIDRQGRLLDLKLVRSSGSPDADKAAIAAVQLAAPFKPLPADFSGNDIDIEFTFDYNVFGVGSSRY